MIAPTSAWNRERPRVVKLRKITTAVTNCFRCQGGVVCIIATIVLPELLLPTSLVKAEDDQRERSALGMLTLHSSPSFILVGGHRTVVP